MFPEEKEKLDHATMLIQIAHTKGWIARYGFTSFSAHDLAWAAMDLVQNVRSEGEHPLDCVTLDIVQILQAAGDID